MENEHQVSSKYWICTVLDTVYLKKKTVQWFLIALIAFKNQK